MRYTCLQTIYELAKKNKKICFVGSDLGFGVLKEFKKKFKDRFFMEGVSEQHITGMAAGLAMEGFIPYFNTIATITGVVAVGVAISYGYYRNIQPKYRQWLEI